MAARLPGIVMIYMDVRLGRRLGWRREPGSDRDRRPSSLKSSICLGQQRTPIDGQIPVLADNVDEVAGFQSGRLERPTSTGTTPRRFSTPSTPRRSPTGRR